MLNTRRCTLGLVVGAAITLLPTTPAAATPAYTGQNVDVWLTGGTATPLYQCLSDAQDGRVTTQLAACRRAAQTGSSVRLTATVWVFARPGGRIPVAHRSNAVLVISGPVAAAVNRRVNDARDGSVDQRNNCTQIAVAGNSLRLSGVTIVIGG